MLLIFLTLCASFLGDLTAEAESIASGLISQWNAKLASEEKKLEACSRVFVDAEVNEPTFFEDAKKRPAVKVQNKKQAETLKKSLRNEIATLKKQISEPKTWSFPAREINELQPGYVGLVLTKAGDGMARRGPAGAQAGSLDEYEIRARMAEASQPTSFDVRDVVPTKNGFMGTYGKYVIKFSADDAEAGPVYSIKGIVRIEAISDITITLKVLSQADQEGLHGAVTESLKEMAKATK